MIATLLTSGFVPFSLALGLLMALLVLEIVSQLVGGSLLSADDGPDLDLDMDAAAETAFDFEPGAEIDAGDLPEPGEADSPVTPDGTGGILDVLGLAGVPLLLWFAAFLLSFGSAGLLLQQAALSVAGAPIPWPGAVALTLPLGLAGARFFARAFAAVLPKTETTATREQFFGGLRGTVTQGTARRGHPAEVRLHDRHGNIHYVRAEPFEAAAEIAEGTDVILVRERRGPGEYILRLVPLTGL